MILVTSKGEGLIVFFFAAAKRMPFPMMILNRGAFIMPNRPVRDLREYARKTERHFPLEPGKPKGMDLAIFQ